MCRLIMIQHAKPGDSQQYLAWFRDLAETGMVPLGTAPGHQDGWGLGGFQDGKLIFFDKEGASAWQNPAYDQAVSAIVKKRCDVIIGHLRKSSVGKKLLENTHPFVYRDFLFCHNGTIFNRENLKLEPDYETEIRGGTDSERFFMYLMQLIHQGNDKVISADLVRVSILKAIGFIRDNFDYAGLNFIISDGKNTWVVREINESNAHVIEMKMLDYYTLFLGQKMAGPSIIVASEKFAAEGIAWQPLDNHELLEIDGNTGAISKYVC